MVFVLVVLWCYLCVWWELQFICYLYSDLSLSTTDFLYSLTFFSVFNVLVTSHVFPTFINLRFHNFFSAFHILFILIHSRTSFFTAVFFLDV